MYKMHKMVCDQTIDKSVSHVHEQFTLTEMPLFRKFPEIRKFQLERKNFRKNETVLLDINN